MTNSNPPLSPLTSLDTTTLPANRRDFLYISTAVVGATGVALATWPFIDNMNPAADVLAVSKIELDLAPIQSGQRITVKWRGSPVFVVHRTARQIAEARLDDNNNNLIDPATDASRAPREQWLVVIGVCTHLGCIPLGQGENDQRGDWNGWFCPCHGSIYDISGRVRRGPAPKNLYLPPYKFISGEKILIG